MAGLFWLQGQKRQWVQWWQGQRRVHLRMERVLYISMPKMVQLLIRRSTCALALHRLQDPSLPPVNKLPGLHKRLILLVYVLSACLGKPKMQIWRAGRVQGTCWSTQVWRIQPAIAEGLHCLCLSKMQAGESICCTGTLRITLRLVHGYHVCCAESHR